MERKPRFPAHAGDGYRVKKMDQTRLEQGDSQGPVVVSALSVERFQISIKSI